MYVRLNDLLLANDVTLDLLTCIQYFPRSLQLVRSLVKEHPYLTFAQLNNQCLLLGLKALAIYRGLGDEANTAIVLNDLGGMVQRRKDYDQAERYYQEALAIDEERGSKEGQATLSGSSGALALERGRLVEARRWYERELALAQEVQREDLVAQALGD